MPSSAAGVAASSPTIPTAGRVPEAIPALLHRVAKVAASQPAVSALCCHRWTSGALARRGPTPAGSSAGVGSGSGIWSYGGGGTRGSRGSHAESNRSGAGGGSRQLTQSGAWDAGREGLRLLLILFFFNSY